MEESEFLNQKIRVQKKFSNYELKFAQYFHRKSKVFPENIIIIGNIIFFFVKNEYYLKSKKVIGVLRKEIKNKKISIVRNENSLIKLIFSFFPDTYIHDVKIEANEKDHLKTIVIYFLSFKERGIAVGCKGNLYQSN